MATRVRTHKVTRDGKTHTRQQHTRAGKQAPQWFQPARAWRNAKQSRRLWKTSETNAALLLGAAAVSEILGFVVFKGAGAIFIVIGVLFAAAGYAMKDRT